MNLAALQKAGGFSIILGSLFLVIYSTAFFFLLPIREITADFTLLVLNPNWRWIAAIAFAGIVLMLFGFASVYSRMYAESGKIGLLGFLFIELAYLLQACKVTWELFLYPVIAANPASAFLLRDGVLKQAALVIGFRATASITIFLGIILFCLALVRSKEFPKIAGILVFVGAFVYALGPLLSIYVALTGIVILSIGCLVLGLTLMQRG